VIYNLLFRASAETLRKPICARIGDGDAEMVEAKSVPRSKLGSVRLLQEELEARGIKSKSWASASGRLIDGKAFSRGALYLMLQNRLYRGEIVHKGQSHLARVAWTTPARLACRPDR
jgi:hypothetical protein